VIQQLIANPPEPDFKTPEGIVVRRPRALVLAPTSELVHQIAHELKQIGMNIKNFSVGTITGDYPASTTVCVMRWRRD
jgi:superfamily II DNA/RNA helicase